MQTQKYIVEAPIPKKGQTASSGGIREKGTIVAQYKDPIPYTEPHLPSRKEQFNQEMKDIAFDFILDVVSDLWYEFGRPIVKAKLHQLEESISAKLTATRTNQVIEAESTVIETEEIPCKLADNIIHFRQKNAG